MGGKKRGQIESDRAVEQVDSSEGVEDNISIEDDVYECLNAL